MSNHNDRLFRTIAPKPLQPRGGPPGLSSTSSNPNPQTQATPGTPREQYLRPQTDPTPSLSSRYPESNDLSPSISRISAGVGGGNHTLVACTACRKRKTKCDGKRPVCTSCVNKTTACEYVAEEKESHVSALKRKNNALIDESEQLRYLVNYLIKCAEEDAIDIVRHLRRYQDVPKTIELLKDSSLLLPLSRPSPPREPLPYLTESSSSRSPYYFEDATPLTSGPSTLPPLRTLSTTSPPPPTRSGPRFPNDILNDDDHQ